jgi:hypothetical protein
MSASALFFKQLAVPLEKQWSIEEFAEKLLAGIERATLHRLRIDSNCL